MTTDEFQGQILDAIFASIFDPVAIYKVTGGTDGEPVDLVYQRVNDAYCRHNRRPREFFIGNKFTEATKDESNDGWRELMLKVAFTDSSGFSDETGGYVNSGYYEGFSTGYDLCGGYYQMFAFSPIKGYVIAIIRDMTEWYEATEDLKEKEHQLLASREDLRRLTSNLTLAEERTRRGIATTLHDTLGYSMVSLLHGMKALQSMDGAERETKLAELIENTQKLIDDTRAFTFSISPPLLYEVGLDAALASRCDALGRTHNIDCRFCSCGGERSIPEDTKILLYQIAHELLVNVVKHSKATKATVQTRWGAKKVQLFVEDNGVGFDAEREHGSAETPGMGLFSIKERVETVGGQCSIISSPGGGTIINVVVPIAEEHAAKS